MATDRFQDLVYAAGHDLQEPLRSILAYAELLDRKVAGDPEAHELCTFILDGARRMRDLLQQLTIYSRAGTAKKRVALKLNVPLQRALLKLSTQLAATGARVQTADLPEVIGDEAELAQVFEHLIGNALKFHPKNGGAPEIAVQAEQGSDDTETIVSVSDNGSGIEEQYHAQVLQPFYRLHGKDYPGQGLGLAVCEKIVQSHGGRLWVESDGAKGTSLRFTLPV